MSRKTIFSEDRLYRYTLWRDIEQPDMFAAEAKSGYVNFIGLNPSTADEFKNDNTIRRCIRFCKDWGYSEFCMTNLYAYRSTVANEMFCNFAPVGDDNDKWIVEIAKRAAVVVAAWGKFKKAEARAQHILKLLTKAKVNVQCIGLNNDGTPCHPLYMPKDSVLSPFGF